MSEHLSYSNQDNDNIVTNLSKSEPLCDKLGKHTIII